MSHDPVLLNKVMQFLRPEDGTAFIDATINGGGHSSEILKRMSRNSLLLGIDQDEEMLEKVRLRFEHEDRLHTITGNFRNLYELAHNLANGYDGILFDLGLSSIQLESSGRGFSFQRDEPLIMTFKKNFEPGDLIARDIVNQWREEDLARVIKEFGEERFAYSIAKHIVLARKSFSIQTTGELIRIIFKAVPKKYHHSRIHPATRTFQALRIVVNDELGALEDGMQEAWKLLKDGGRLVIISFHSLEDRLVKKYFNKLKSGEGATILTKKPVVPSKIDIEENPRARSAKLRAIVK